MQEQNVTLQEIQKVKSINQIMPNTWISHVSPSVHIFNMDGVINNETNWHKELSTMYKSSQNLHHHMNVGIHSWIFTFNYTSSNTFYTSFSANRQIIELAKTKY